jgi:pimeloyl-ACP methyl ester carboxylesterase
MTVPIAFPLRLRGMGAFHVGGREVELSGLPVRDLLMAEGGQPVRVDPNGRYIVEQMYAQYFLADPDAGRLPLLLWHGGGMTGATWETTPDGRPGWLHEFLRRGRDVYLCDAVERGRSGFAPVPHVWPEAPVIQTPADIYTRFRIGTKDTFTGGHQPYADTQFPVECFDALARQMVPRWTTTDAAVLTGYLALLERVGPAVIVCHSQAGVFALRAAHARPDLVRAVVALEPASVPAFDISAGAFKVPTLVVLGDHIESDARWSRMAERIRAFEKAHDSVDILSLPDVGMRGNSHMLMMDRNSLDIASRVADWLASQSA